MNRKSLTVWLLCFTAGFAAGVGSGRSWPAPQRQQQKPAARLSPHEVTVEFAREWDVLRERAGNEAEREELRQQWRQRYDAALKEACLREGVALPPHLQD